MGLLSTKALTEVVQVMMHSNTATCSASNSHGHCSGKCDKCLSGKLQTSVALPTVHHIETAGSRVAGTHVHRTGVPVDMPAENLPKNSTKITAVCYSISLPYLTLPSDQQISCSAIKA